MKALAEHYADLLTKGDVMQLFRVLERTGSISEACRLAGIDRKTVYNWEKVREIRRETKVKVLAAALELSPKETLEFVADRAVERAAEVASHLLALTFELAMRAKSREEFEELYAEFHRLLDKYSRPLLKGAEYELNELQYLMKKRAARLGLTTFAPYITSFLKEAFKVEVKVEESSAATASVCSFTSFEEAGELAQRGREEPVRAIIPPTR